MVLKLARGMPEACYFIKVVHVCFRIFTVLEHLVLELEACKDALGEGRRYISNEDYS